MSDFRLIPSIEQLRQRPAVRALEARFGADATRRRAARGGGRVRGAHRAAATRALTTKTRSRRGSKPTAAAQLDDAFRPSLQPVINATGVILHTNLGRAPLARGGDRRASPRSRAATRRSNTTWRAERAAGATCTPRRCSAA